MEYMLMPLKRYADFQGRSRRKEYWMFFLFNIILAVVAGVLGNLIFGPGEGHWINNIISLVLLIPSIAVGVRRMHDLDKSGWFIIIPIYALILTLTDGTHGPNRFGEDPKGQNLQDVFS